MIHTKTETSEKHICTCPRLSAIEKERRRGEKFPILPELCLRRLNIQKRLTIHAWTNLQSDKNSMMLGWEPWKVDAGDVELADGDVDGVQVGPGVVGDWSGVWDLSGVPLLYKQLLNQKFNCKTFATLWILWTQKYPSSQGGVYLSLEKQMGVAVFGLESQERMLLSPGRSWW